MARTYKRDSRGRFAGGGGGSSGGSGGGGKKRGRPAGPSGGKVGSSAQQKKNAAAQADRSKRFSSKSTTGREAKAAWKAAKGAALRAANGASSMSDPTLRKTVRRAKQMIATRSTAAPKRGRPAGASGGKVGSQTQQRQNARAQAARTKAFSSKATGSGRSAKAAYKEATSAVRYLQRSAAMGGGNRSSLPRAQKTVAQMEKRRRTTARTRMPSQSKRKGKR